MAKKINVLAELLKCALFDFEIDEQVKKLISDNARAVYDMAMRHDLVHLVEYALKKSEIAILDEALAYEYLKQQAMAVMRYENQNSALIKLSELFEEEKIPFIPLKGAVIRKIYPEPWMRTSCDIDILVKEEDIERAEKAVVEKLGYTSKGERDYHDVSLYYGADVHLELHFSIKENIEKFDKLLEHVWDYATPKSDGTFEFVLTNEFFIFQTVAHMANHFVRGGCGVKSIIDVYLLKRSLVFDEDAVLEMLELCGIKTFYESLLHLINVWFSDAVNDEITTLMHWYILDGGAYGSKRNSIAVERADKGELSYALNRIFMPYEQLVITYPHLKGKPVLTPFYQIKRWFRILSDGRTKDSAMELYENGRITAQKSDSVNELFQKIGLK